MSLSFHLKLQLLWGKTRCSGILDINCYTFSVEEISEGEIETLHVSFSLALEIKYSNLPSNKHCSHFFSLGWGGVLYFHQARVATSLTHSQSILTYYILYTASLRQTNRTSEIHLLLWFVDISRKTTLQHHSPRWKSTLFVQQAGFNTDSSTDSVHVSELGDTAWAPII